MPSNTAVFLPSKTQPNPLSISSAPYTSPIKDQIVIKNNAIAINPIDWILQGMGNLMYAWLKYPQDPVILGTDVAGEVVEIGPNVTRFKIGDRVVGNAIGLAEKYNDPAMGGFQEYTVLLSHMTSPIPSTLSYENAVVLPLGLSTAACSLFQKDQLAMTSPSLNPTPQNKTLLVWGGSTSVGSNAIQLARAAGYEVVATCSPKNFAYCKSLGATAVFDYSSSTVVADLIALLKDKEVAGAMSIGQGAAEGCLDVLDKCRGNKFVSMISYPMLKPTPTRFVMPRTAIFFVSWMVTHWVKCKIRGIRSKFVFGDTLVGNGIGKAIYEDFLPGALEEGRFICAPEPLVVGKGLEKVQEGIDIQRKGMSARKVVVTL